MTTTWNPIWLDRFAAQTRFVYEAIADLSPEQWNMRPVEGAWSIRELVVHVVDCDLVGGWRMRRVIAEPDPAFWAFDENAFMNRLAPDKRDLNRLAQLFELHRLDLLDILRTLPAEDFERTGRHSEAGIKRLADLVQGFTQHVEGHRKHLNLKRERLAVSPTQEVY